MAYTALNEMRQTLQDQYKGVEMGPKSPAEIKISKGRKVDFITAVKHFIHERCVDLRFDAKIANEEKLTGALKGKSVREGQIPYNMQMDIDRLCLARAVERFMVSGSKEDAFDVYFCFLEMFGGGYGSSRRMIELLSEYESTASTMLMSHRDHYSHSVYVFLLGLAMFDAIPDVREQYKKYYNIIDDINASHHFLQFWGMTALFHDIGYPFEIAFEQVKSYFTQRDKENGTNTRMEQMPLIGYCNMDAYLRLDDRSKSKLKDWYKKDFDTIDEWMAYDIANVIGGIDCKRINQKTDKDILTILKDEAAPSSHKKRIDHAYFSTIVLFKELFEELNSEDSRNPLKREHMDALTAIALHNSLYKRKIAEDKELALDDHAFMIEWHPLAYLLQFTDELQCWDRTSYGRNTRTELHPMSCNLEFDEKGIYAEYVFDMAENKKIVEFWNKYEEYERNPEAAKPRLKKFSDMTRDNVFAQEIGLIVGLSNYGSRKGRLRLVVTPKVEEANWHNKHLYLSSSNFIHIYEFAAALNAQFNQNYASDKVMLDDFDMLSLEYKLSNIGQAKFFAEALDKIGCFFTDRPVAYEMVVGFSEQELVRLGEYEHERWENEKWEMCWLPGSRMADELKKNKNELREKARMHYDLNVQFDDLSNLEKRKDMSPLNVMMSKLLEFDGIRVYRYK